MEVSQKLKIELPYDPIISLLRIFKKKKNHKYICTQVFTAAFTITKIWKQPKCPSTNEWIKKKKE